MSSAKVKKKKRQLPVAEPAVHKEAGADPLFLPATGVRKKKKLKKRKAVAADLEVTTPESALPKKKKRKKIRATETDGETAGHGKTPAGGKDLPDLGLSKADFKGNKKVVEARAKSEDTTVFVDGLPYVWAVDKVEDHFRDCGKIVEVRAPTWQDSGRLRGFAHVTFLTKAGREKALAMDGTKVDNKGRYLKIEAAKAPSTDSGPTADVQGKRRLFVKNLPYDATEKSIGELFAKCGKVQEVRVPTSFGRSKGFAYVQFQKPEFLKAAISMKPPPSLQGRTLRLDVDLGTGPKAGFHFREEAFDSAFGPKRGGGGGGKGDSGGDGKGKGRGKDAGGKGKGKGRGKGMPKMSLF